MPSGETSAFLGIVVVNVAGATSIFGRGGAYTVRVRVGACDSQLSEPALITTGVSSITTNDSLALCGPASSATLTANAGTSWLWSNGATTQSITAAAGTDSVVVTDALGGTIEGTFQVAKKIDWATLTGATYDAQT